MKHGFLVLLLVASFTSGARAQSLTTGAISGVVKDQATGVPLGGVTIIATSPASAPQMATSADDGTYKITELLPGTWTVTFYYQDASTERSGIEVGADRTSALYVRMRVGDPEPIHVDGTPLPIHVDSTAHQVTFGRPELESLPVPGPTFESAAGAIGGAQNDGVGVAYSGSSSLENRYYVDGIDITGLTYGDVGTPLMNEFIQEMNVTTGGYNAEYGRATGGIVNIVTRSGTDKLRGSVFGVLRPGFLVAKTDRAPINASSIDVTADNAYNGHLGFELGGPIVKGKAWFYAGLAPQFSRTNITRTVKRQTDCRHLQDDGKPGLCRKEDADGEPDIDPATGFFITEDLESDVRASTAMTYSMLGKITLAPSAGNQAQISLIAMPQHSERPGLLGLPSSGRQSRGLTTDAAIRWTSKLAEGKTEISAVLAWHRSTLNVGSIDPSLDSEPLQVLTDGDLGTWSKLGGESPTVASGCADGGTGDPYLLITNCPVTQYTIGGPGRITHDKEERRTARIALTQRVRAVGTHEIKAGLDLDDDATDKARLYSGGAFIQNLGSAIIINRFVELAGANDLDPRFDQLCSTPDDSGSVMSGSKTFRCAYIPGTVGAPGTIVSGQTLNWAAYLRDSWQVRPNLTLNAGVRYEEQRMRYAKGLRNSVDSLTGELLGTNAMVLRGNFAPRVGVIYDPTSEGHSKIYAHWGRFYESVPMDINDRSFGGEVSYQQVFDADSCGAVDPKLGGPDGKNCTGTPLSEQLIGSSGVLVAPGIQAEYIDEVLAGAEYALTKDLVVGIAVQHRRLGRAIEDVSTDGADTYIIANPGEWSAAEERKLEQRIAQTTDKLAKQRLEKQLALFRGIRTFDRPSRDYDSLELTVGRRFTKGLYLSGSYTYSRTYGNYPGSVSYDNGQIDPNISSQYDLIELMANRKGRLPQDRPHSIKLDAYKPFAIGAGQLVIGTRIRAISGVPMNALAGHYLYGADESFLLPRGQLGRTGIQHGIDIHVGYKRKLTATTGAELFFDVFNLYNNQGTFNVDETYAPYYRINGEQQNVNPISGGSYSDLIWAKTLDTNGTETNQPIGRNPNFHRTTSRYAPASAQVGFRVTF